MANNHRLLSYDAIIDFWSHERGDAVALEQDGRETSYRALDEATRRLIGFLRDNGIGKGDRIAWLGKNSDLYAMLYLAAARMGAVMVPIGWRLAAPEVAYILEDTAAPLLFVGEEFEPLAQAALREGTVRARIVPESEARRAAASHKPADYQPAGPDDAVLQLYTSGTTGRPKGAVLSNRNLFALRIHAIEAELPWSNYQPGDCILVAMPVAHIGGTGLINIAISNGIRALVQSEFTPVGVLEAIERGATQMFIVPAALQMVIEHPRAATTDFSALKYLMYGAAPMPLELLKQAVATMPNAGFLQAYGMTETTGTISLLPPEDHSIEGNQRMRSAGKAVPGVEIRVVDEQGREVERGTIGEVVVKSPSNMLGYWNRPEATAEALKDGWMHTGDAAIMDEDGYIYIQDRIKDMIISGGENVYPAEVENAIFGHPDVAEVAVIGVPSDRWGEEVKACVVPKPGRTVDPNAIISWARERLAAFKVPKSIDVIDALPRNPSGKILRRELREPYWEGHERRVN